jgi:hypothetical protein
MRRRGTVRQGAREESRAAEVHEANRREGDARTLERDDQRGHSRRRPDPRRPRPVLDAHDRAAERDARGEGRADGASTASLGSGRDRPEMRCARRSASAPLRSRVGSAYAGLHDAWRFERRPRCGGHGDRRRAFARKSPIPTWSNVRASSQRASSCQPRCTGSEQGDRTILAASGLLRARGPKLRMQFPRRPRQLRVGGESWHRKRGRRRLPRCGRCCENRRCHDLRRRPRCVGVFPAGRHMCEHVRGYCDQQGPLRQVRECLFSGSRLRRWAVRLPAGSLVVRRSLRRYEPRREALWRLCSRVCRRAALHPGCLRLSRRAILV